MINLDQMLATPGTLTGFRTYHEVLQSARVRLSASERWTQEAFARDEHGHPVKPRDPRACCWCMLGGIACESNPYGIIPPPIMTFLGEMVGHVFGEGRFSSLGAMNDYVSHEVVLDFLDQALAQFTQEAP